MTPYPTPSFAALDAEGYQVLRAAIPPAWIAPLQAAFERGVLASDRWQVPRRADWRHACVDGDPLVQRACRLPALLAGVRHLLKTPFFLSQVEGRAPCPGNAPQPLHRDGAGEGHRLAAAMLWLDAWDAGNGATQVVPASHRGDAGWDEAAGAAAGAEAGAEAGADPGANATGRAAARPAPITLAGAAGDILLFHPDLLHGATSNTDGRPRRALLLSYAAAELREAHAATAALRGVTMAMGEVWE